MEIIDKIRKAADIVQIARGYTKLKRRGKKHVGLCPFHKEAEPSFTVDGEKQLFHCFGCGVGGDVFTLVMEKENLTFPEAMKYLANRYHIKIMPEFIPSEIERSILSLAGYKSPAGPEWLDGRLGYKKLSSIVSKWAKNETSDKVFLHEIICFIESLRECQEALREWNRLSEMQGKAENFGDPIPF